MITLWDARQSTYRRPVCLMLVDLELLGKLNDRHVVSPVKVPGGRNVIQQSLRGAAGIFLRWRDGRRFGRGGSIDGRGDGCSRGAVHTRVTVALTECLGRRAEVGVDAEWRDLELVLR